MAKLDKNHYFKCKIQGKYYSVFTARYCSSKLTEIYMWMPKLDYNLSGLNLDGLLLTVMP